MYNHLLYFFLSLYKVYILCHCSCVREVILVSFSYAFICIALQCHNYFFEFPFPKCTILWKLRWSSPERQSVSLLKSVDSFLPPLSRADAPTITRSPVTPGCFHPPYSCILPRSQSVRQKCSSAKIFFEINQMKYNKMSEHSGKQTAK